MQKDSVDLMNIEYADVLHLYRGWRRSESALKDKNKELSALKARIAQLQESHVKFRGQIQSLDSVKDLTVTLQNQLSAMQQDNKQLLDENKELAQLNVKADELLREKESSEENQTKMLRSIQMEFATLKGRYEETTKVQKGLEKLVSDEQALRLTAESRMRQAQETTNALKEENKDLRQQLSSTVLRLKQCDQELLHASDQLSNLASEVSTINAAKHDLSTKDAEVGLLKGDISRLLRLLEHSPATKGFIAHWLDSGGMDFIGINHHQHGHDLSAVASSDGAVLSASILAPSSPHHLFMEQSAAMTEFADDNNYFLNHSNVNGGSTTGGIDHTMIENFNLTPAEFAHLKRVHGGDPFPMTPNMMEEAEYWVPSEAAQLGLQFLSNKVPHASPKVIMDFLRSMNKIWLRRERRKIKRVKSVLCGSIEDLKRQLAQAKPYKGVLAERQIRRLRNQVKGERLKQLTGRPRRSLEGILSNSNATNRFEYEDQEDEGEEEEWGHEDSLQHRQYYSADESSGRRRSASASAATTASAGTVLPHDRRLCRIMARKAQQQAASASGNVDVQTLSTEKLLEASLNSLESIGRQMQQHQAVMTGGGGGSNSVAVGGEGDANNSRSYNNLSPMKGSMLMQSLNLSQQQQQQHAVNQSTMSNSSSATTSGNNSYPQESYLRGAMWLGRNFVILSEELAESMDALRTKCIAEVSTVSQDPDPRRCCHRLTLLANSALTQAHTMTNKSRSKFREILQNTAALRPGDSKAFRALLRNLPIESALTNSNNGGNSTNNNGAAILNSSSTNRNNNNYSFQSIPTSSGEGGGGGGRSSRNNITPMRAIYNNNSSSSNGNNSTNNNTQQHHINGHDDGEEEDKSGDHSPLQFRTGYSNRRNNNRPNSPVRNMVPARSQSPF